MYQGKTIKRYETDYEVKIVACKSLVITSLPYLVRTQEREQKALNHHDLRLFCFKT